MTSSMKHARVISFHGSRPQDGYRATEHQQVGVHPRRGRPRWAFPGLHSDGRVTC
jgi:hypothetical protein